MLAQSQMRRRLRAAGASGEMASKAQRSAKHFSRPGTKRGSCLNGAAAAEREPQGARRVVLPVALTLSVALERDRF